MRLELYKAAMKEMEQRSQEQRLGHMLRDLALRYDLSYSTLRGMYANGIKSKVKMNAQKHRKKEEEYLAEYIRLVHAKRAQAMLELAEAVDHQPFLLARLLLSALFQQRHAGAGKDEKTTLKQWLAAPEEMVVDCEALGLPLPVLRSDVLLAIEHDDSYGPLADTMRQNVGLEYEYVLQEQLRAHGVSFLTEEAQRIANFPKTPDAMLTIPIEVEGQLVYWIDSKACFGDPRTLEVSYHDQFFQYLSRIGPGMVIYWFGFVHDCQVGDRGEGKGGAVKSSNERWHDEGLLLVDKFPEAIVRSVAEEAAALGTAR